MTDSNIQAAKETYKKNRYLKHLDEKDLKQRLGHILNNLLIINNDGKISLLSPKSKENPYSSISNEVIYHYRLMWVDILEEFELRDRPYPNGFGKDTLNRKEMPQPQPHLSKALTDAISKYSTQNEILVKYGKLSDLEKLFTEGNLRIRPASDYNDPSLNHAIKDNELEFLFHCDTTHSKGSVKIKYPSSTNYYVYCLSNLLSPRLFTDFDANACIIIKQPSKFINDVSAEFCKQKPNWMAYPKNVRYVDPIFHEKLDAYDLFEVKHFRYLYQDEVRIIFLPEKEKNNLKEIDLEIGSIREYSELIPLN